MIPITIEQHFLSISNQTDIKHDIASILYDINLAAKFIRKEVIRSSISDNELNGSSNTINASGEVVQKLDIYSNDVIKHVLTSHQRFCYLGSEEEETIIQTDTYDTSDYVILFDPLDGSSNIDVNISVGTIFSIFKKNKSAQDLTDHCFQKGSEQIAAGYIIYGSSVMMVYTAGNGVHGFTYDPTIGEFLLSHENITIPNSSKYYSINESLYSQCNYGTQSFIDHLKTIHLSSRYVGSLVADFHRNLLKGGIYIYPATTNLPNGKLRLLYEANPLAYICEQAGGAATNGQENILNLTASSLHERVPLFIGSKNLIELHLSKYASLINHQS